MSSPSIDSVQERSRSANAQTVDNTGILTHKFLLAIVLCWCENGAIAFPALALENIPVVLDWLQKVVEQ